MDNKINITNNKILFVDNEELILTKIKRKLKDKDYDMFFVQSGQEALNILNQHTIAVIVIDLNLPDFTGIELIKIINEKFPDIIKIIFSIYSDMKIISKTQAKNIYQYIPKARISKEDDYRLELMPVVHNALEKYNLIQENKNMKKAITKITKNKNKVREYMNG